MSINDIISECYSIYDFDYVKKVLNSMVINLRHFTGRPIKVLCVRVSRGGHQHIYYPTSSFDIVCSH